MCVHNGRYIYLIANNRITLTPALSDIFQVFSFDICPFVSTPNLDFGSGFGSHEGIEWTILFAIDIWHMPTPL